MFESMVVNCPVCKTETRDIKWEYKRWKIYACSHCDLEFAWPFISGDLEFYKEFETYKKLRLDIEARNFHPGSKPIAKAIANTIKKCAIKSKKIRVLDYGCGSGYFASLCKRSGCDVLCVDFNPEMVKIAKECFGLHAYVKSAEALIQEHAEFDVILLNHILEHVDAPVEFLRKFSHLLNHGGLIFISLPNRNYVREREKLRNGQMFLDHYPPHHIGFWSTKSLAHALDAAGFEVVSCQAQTYPVKELAEISLRTRFHWHIMPSGIARLLSWIGRLIKINGPNLIAVGRVGEK